MIVVRYEIISKRDNEAFIKNWGWYSSVEQAKETLERQYPSDRCIVKIK
jgi:hypothetical protein